MRAALRFTSFALLLAPVAAIAHPGHSGSHLMHGFSHPILGLDHFLAMLAVGIWAAQQSGMLRWAIPAGFVASMFAGVTLAAIGVQLPQVEVGIVISVIAFGVAIAFSARSRTALLAVAAFAIFHGHAHGTEASHSLDASYVCGMLAATAILHLIGIAIGVAAQRRLSPSAPRWAGASIALSGLALAVGA